MIVLPDRNAVKEIATVREEIRQAVMTTFYAAMCRSQLPPMTVLSFVAMAVGSAYAEAAKAHCGPGGCHCGWEPKHALDIHRLQAALEAVASPPVISDLSTLEAVGSA